MEDDKGGDEKLLCVPVEKLFPYYMDVHEYTDLPPIVIEQITHFFEHYKDLEVGKWVKVLGWEGPDAAKGEILAGIANYQAKKA